MLKILPFLIVTFLFINVSSVFSQRDSIVGVQVYTQTKALQFGNDFKNQKVEAFPKTIPKSLQTTIYINPNDYNYLVNTPIKEPKRLAYNTGLFAGTALISFGILWVLPESFTNWNKEEMLEYGMFNRWKDNVTAGPVWDEDDLFLNWIMHPYSGAVYYMTARGSGYNKWESFAYSAFMSTFLWEYGIEAFAEIPSWQDLFITPILGSILGEQFFRWKGNILRKDGKVLNSGFLGGASLFLMDPFNEVLDGLGYKNKNNIKTYSAFAPIEYDFRSNETIWGIQIVVAF